MKKFRTECAWRACVWRACVQVCVCGGVAYSTVYIYTAHMCACETTLTLYIIIYICVCVFHEMLKIEHTHINTIA